VRVRVRDRGRWSWLIRDMPDFYSCGAVLVLGLGKTTGFGMFSRTLLDIC
jgi:hypothetical protein